MQNRFTRLLSWLGNLRLTAVATDGNGAAAGRRLAEPANSAQAQALLHAATADTQSVLAGLDSTVIGLTTTEAETRLARYGRNEIAQEQAHTWYQQLFSAFNNPFNLLLLLIAVISWVTGDTQGATIMAIMIIVSTALRFYQEFRSNQAAEKLKAMVSTTAAVSRVDDRREEAEQMAAQYFGLHLHHNAHPPREIPLKDIVPGDIVHLSAGDMVPADLRLITAKDLFISQSALTGEAFPVEKTAERAAAGAVSHALELPNVCFMGTNIVSGTATGVVLATGNNTWFGSLSRSVVADRIQTSFEKGIHRVTWLLIRFMLVMVPLVFVVNGMVKHDWTDAFMFAIAVAVGLTPEMLPMIVTANLARGAVALSRGKVIVKRLNAIQNFGAMDVLCTDKTGTLTQDKIILEKHIDVSGEENDEVLKYAFLNSYYQTGLKNLLDVAVLNHVEMREELNIRNYRKVDEIPFDFARRRMSVVVQEGNDPHLVITKGAVEEIFAVSTRVNVGGEIMPLDESRREEVLAVTRALNEDGLRVIAVAYKEMPATTASYGVRDESDLVLIGYIAFLDPPKETAAPAIAALRATGVTVKILTGDNDIVTRKVCSEVGLDVEHIVLGPEIDAMTDMELADLADVSQVFAKLTPAQKERIVRALHLKGHVVGFMGDGINDSPALKAADIGISVDNAVDIAKESADLILLEKNLMILEKGVIEGRRTFGNTVKYIKMAASSNFGNMFSVLGASALLPFLPMLPIQIIVQNLLYDLSQTTIPFDDVDAEYTAQPRKWEIGDIGRFMLFLGPISSIFDYVTFGLMWYVFGAHDVHHQGLFQSGWFIEGLLTQTFIVHVIRTGRIPFIQSRASLPLLMTTAAVITVGAIIPFTPFGASLGLTALPASYFGWLLVILLGYATLAQLVKSWFVRRFGFN